VTPIAKKPVQSSGTFSLFGRSSSTPKAPPRGPGTISLSSPPKKAAVKPQPNKTPTLNIFGSSPSKPAPKPQPVQPKAAAPKKATSGFSFGLGAAPKPKAAPKVVETPKSAPKKAPTFSLFGGSSSPAPKKVEASQPKGAPKKASGGYSFGGGAKKAAPKAPVVDNIPIVSKFKQNADGSITGVVRNSKSFRNGTEITTSPVRRGAKSGDVVTTSSGSKYRLE
jgi:hypothetical protein